MAKDDKLDRLGRVALFRACSQAELRQIARLAEDVSLAAGDEVVREGTEGREFFVIAEGTATVTRAGRTVATLGPGDYFGELALLGGVPRDASVTAASGMQVVVMGHREFLGLLAEVPSLNAKILAGLARRLHDADVALGGGLRVL
jgi:CRP-like cAMP-binding protein